MNYFESAYCDISYDESVKSVNVIWKGYAKGEQLRDVPNKALELAISKKTDKMLYDTRKMPTLVKEDEEWVYSDWTPRAIAGGIRCMAIIIPGNVVKDKMITRIVDNTTNDDIQRELFSSTEEALDWLK